MLQRGYYVHRPTYKSFHLGKVTAALGGVLLVVVAGFEGSYALWKSTASLGGGQVQAADFRVEMMNPHNAPVDMPDGVNLSEGQDQKPLFPGDSQFHEVTVRNRGTARPEASRVLVGPAARPYAVDTQDAGNRDFAGNLELAVTGGLPESLSCSKADSYASVPMSVSGKPGESIGTTVMDMRLRQGQTFRYCFRLTLKHDAPSSAQGRSVKVTVPLQADQVPG